MKKLVGLLLSTFGIIVIIISIMGLVKAFDVFYESPAESRDFVYTMGSIVFPLLLSVLGRWLFRKGSELRKKQNYS